ncbi:MAG: hypothetical protein JSU68_12870 [Phycisphaerales bacterium]|nr:MAG: hypothetical protein JSU68_12870 [Phycisphaerales bacterium]
MSKTRWMATTLLVAGLTIGAWTRPAAAQCFADWHCLWQEWIVYGVGDWDCVDFNCVENCSNHQCGNGICDALWGESMESCSYDCVDPLCLEPSNCIGQEWNVFCQGHWDCQQGACVPICDYQTCGDGFCDPAGGESFYSCMDDCSLSCEADIDCIDYPWPVDCGGDWDCHEDFCVPNCENHNCGDGFCDRVAGESDESCPIDCPQPICEHDIDCLRLPWLVDCYGHWDCVAGRCVEVCGLPCGDGWCEPWQGEAAATCAPDCPWQCNQDIHCFHKDWIIDCVGQWDCLSGTCIENCDEPMLCGDSVCDYLEGESAWSCFLDCPVCICGDVDYSGGPVNLGDFACLALCFGMEMPADHCRPAQFVCADMDDSGKVDLADLATFAILYGQTATLSPPHCADH